MLVSEVPLYGVETWVGAAAVGIYICIIPAEGVGPARPAATVSNPYIRLFCSALANLGTDDAVPQKISP